MVQNNWEPHISLFKLKEESKFFKREIGELFFRTKDYKLVMKNVGSLLPMLKPFNGNPKINLDDFILRENNFGRIKISSIGSVNDVQYIGAKRRKRSKKRKSKKRSKK